MYNMQANFIALSEVKIDVHIHNTHLYFQSLHSVCSVINRSLSSCHGHGKYNSPEQSLVISYSFSDDI